MKIQESLSNFCQSIQQNASAAASKIKEVAGNAKDAMVNAAHRIAQAIHPHFQKVKQYLTTHKNELGMVAIGAAVGAALYAIANHFFCKKEEAGPKVHGFLKA